MASWEKRRSRFIFYQEDGDCFLCEKFNSSKKWKQQQQQQQQHSKLEGETLIRSSMGTKPVAMLYITSLVKLCFDC